MQFLLNCLKPDAVLMLYVTLFALLGYGYPGYAVRGDGDGIIRLLWVLLGVLAIVSWVRLVFAS